MSNELHYLEGCEAIHTSNYSIYHKCFLQVGHEENHECHCGEEWSENENTFNLFDNFDNVDSEAN